MSPLLRRFGLVSLLVGVSTGCGLENFGYADSGSCGMGACPEPYIPYRPASASVRLRFDVTGLTSEHAGDSYQFVGFLEGGEVISTHFIPVTTQEIRVTVPAVRAELSFVGLVDEYGAVVTDFGCAASMPTRMIIATDASTLDQHYRMTCGVR